LQITGLSRWKNLATCVIMQIQLLEMRPKGSGSQQGYGRRHSPRNWCQEGGRGNGTPFKDGEPKILKQCNLSLTGTDVVDLIITDIGVLQIDGDTGRTTPFGTIPATAWTSVTTWTVSAI
jgi:hypothetical protein